MNINLNKIEDFFSKEIQDLIQNINSNFGINLVAVFELRNQKLISLYACQTILVPDEQNRKTFFIKGKLIKDLSSIIQQGGMVSQNGWNNNFRDIIDSLPLSLHTYSENMFGFICFGIQNY